MPAFDPNNPFPLVSSLAENYSYAEAQAHSEQVDRWLGLRTHETEARIASSSKRYEKDQQLWIGLPVQALLTPYSELREILALLSPQPGQAIVDLGAGYSRMAFIIARHYPGVRFLGYELVRERVEEGLRCLGPLAGERIEVRQADLGAKDFMPEPADYYFIYDYGARLAVEKTLADLRQIARGRAITVVGRGRASRDAIERGQPWLSKVVDPLHFRNFSVYRSA